MKGYDWAQGTTLKVRVGMRRLARRGRRQHKVTLFSSAVSDKHSIRNAVIATVIGGIVLAGLGQLWQPARRVLGWGLGLLSASVTIPVWVVLLVVAVVVIVVVRVVRAGRGEAAVEVESLASTGESAEPPIRKRVRRGLGPRAAASGPSDATGISTFESDVLARIAKDDGYPVGLDTLKRSLAVSHLKLNAAVDRLEAVDLVQMDEEYEDCVVLTARGRQYVLDHRLAR